MTEAVTKEEVQPAAAAEGEQPVAEPTGEAVPPTEDVAENNEAAEPAEEAPGDGYAQDDDDEGPGSDPVRDAQNEMADDEDLEEDDRQLPELPEEVTPLVISEAHENFQMDKKYEDDPTLGLPNNKHLICQLCEVVIIPEMYSVKVKNEVDLIKNTLREYDICDTYWHVDAIEKF